MAEPTIQSLQEQRIGFLTEKIQSIERILESGGIVTRDTSAELAAMRKERERLVGLG